MLRIPFEDVESRLADVLRGLGFSDARAEVCARLFAETTCDGVYSHGVNRFARFVAMVRNGSVDPAAEPRVVARFGALERWDGQRGPGNLNARAAMERAIALSREHGIGCVAMANTNHWMRGGTYGWQAADAGVIGMCWTNTMPNVPPWGGVEPAIGNNPLVIAVPRAKGHVVLDMAMSQFSYGALESYRKRGELLPVDGGFDAEGKLTRDPGEIEKSQRLLPVGFWKGSGLAVVLDMVAAMTSLGNATHAIANDPLQRDWIVADVCGDESGGRWGMRRGWSRLRMRWWSRCIALGRCRRGRRCGIREKIRCDCEKRIGGSDCRSRIGCGRRF